MKKIAIFGSTGSIGSSLLKIIKKDKKNFNVQLLTTNENYQKLLLQVKFFNVKNIIVTNIKSFLIVKKILKRKKINIYNNFDCLEEIFYENEIDYTMSAISGFDGLKPTLNILKFTKTIAIANKESIICGWSLIEKKLKKHNTKFVPVDSEHFSIWSLLNNQNNNNIEKVFITASGGPFLNFPIKNFKSITPNLALKHPNWSMGKKISIDSATMMNKIFEIIEAKKIFRLKYNQLKILIHPQSYLHAIVKFNNGLSKLLVHDTTMEIPIFNSLYYKTKKIMSSKKININVLNNLSLKTLDKKVYPAIKILDLISNNDSLYDTVIVSANDKLVELFLNKVIKFTDISSILLKLLKKEEFIKYKLIKPKNINDIQRINKYVGLKIISMCV